MKNYYKILGVSLTADNGEIEQAYTRLASLYFPDGNKPIGTEEKFIEVHEAYETLINQHNRTSYDWALKVYYSSLHPNKNASRQFGYGGYTAVGAATYAAADIVENTGRYEEVPLIKVFVWLFCAGCGIVVFVLMLKLLTIFR